MTKAARHTTHIVMGTSQQGYVLMKRSINARLKVILSLSGSHNWCGNRKGRVRDDGVIGFKCWDGHPVR